MVETIAILNIYLIFLFIFWTGLFLNTKVLKPENHCEE